MYTSIRGSQKGYKKQKILAENQPPSPPPHQAAEHARNVFQDGGGMSQASHAQGLGETAAISGTPTKKACTLCVVRPHVVRDGGLGAVLSFVAERGFQVGVFYR